MISDTPGRGGRGSERANFGGRPYWMAPKREERGEGEGQMRGERVEAKGKEQEESAERCGARCKRIDCHLRQAKGEERGEWRGLLLYQNR